MTKKRFITLFIAIVMISALLTGCGPDSRTTQSTKKVDEATALGNYFLYETEEREEYLTFLETFDNSKYEIIDISVGYTGKSVKYGYMTLYSVTYITIE